MNSPLPVIGGLDPGIAEYVAVLREHGVFTIESCDGGEGHAYAEPTIKFSGGRGEGFRALALALDRGWPVRRLDRSWKVSNGEPAGPRWLTSLRGESRRPSLAAL